MRNRFWMLLPVVLTVSSARGQEPAIVTPWAAGCPGLPPVNGGADMSALPAVPHFPVLAQPAVSGFRHDEKGQNDQGGRSGMPHLIPHVHVPLADSRGESAPKFKSAPRGPTNAPRTIYEFKVPAASASATAGENVWRAGGSVSEFRVSPVSAATTVGEGLSRAGVPAAEFGVSKLSSVGTSLSRGGEGILAGVGKLFAAIGAGIAAGFRALFRGKSTPDT